ncbi:MAG: tRNA pseudouridine(55) synthase TruB [Acidobacteria bacterium]|nr:tRNA pseudouridine(55) synthase TruB [Acidobacteriota bacterium]
MNGVFIIDKPEGLTSHDVVQRIRKMFKTSKVGHLGTLDPMATGVLPVCIGKGTRLGQFLPNSPKEYIGEIRFGFSTTTYDRQGTITGSEQPVTVTRAEIEQAMAGMTGEIEQIPPPFSAKKLGGVPAHKLARRGATVEIAPVKVTVYAFEMTRLELPLMTFRVVCSPGTYIRSLAHDLGRKVGCGAHLTSLRRTRSGDFTEADAVPLQRLSAEDLIPMDQMLASWPRIEVGGTDEDRVVHGNPIPGSGSIPFARIFNKKGEFIALASVENGLVRPRLVLTSITSG